ncbi:hypothetical protein, partial [Nocardia cyriacigeorgica]|uniref:hypothetical protein n=1 Tax=Nocardia cyriacigeorgica TaxID=135487 RepID=UPI001E309A35
KPCYLTREFPGVGRRQHYRDRGHLMALSEPDARILAALASLDDGAALSVPELCRATGFSESTIRT